MVAYTKNLKVMSAAFYQTNRRNHHSSTQRMSYSNSHHARGININIGSQSVASTKPWNSRQLQFIKQTKRFSIKGELHSNYILLRFALIVLEWDSITLFTKIIFFFLPKLTFQHHLNKIYMAFYLLTWTYFNDVNGGKNLNLKESFLWVATGKNETKLRKTEKIWKKKITAMKVTSVKMRYQI